MKADKLIKKYWKSRVKSRELNSLLTKEQIKWLTLKEEIISAGFEKELKKSKDPQTYNSKTNSWVNKKSKK